jgi:hypothetical protein
MCNILHEQFTEYGDNDEPDDKDDEEVLCEERD